MPTTAREQLFVGIHQTEKVLTRVPAGAQHDAFATELDAYLEDVRAAADDARIRELFPLLQALHLRIVQASR